MQSGTTAEQKFPLICRKKIQVELLHQLASEIVENVPIMLTKLVMINAQEEPNEKDYKANINELKRKPPKKNIDKFWLLA